MAGEIRKEEEMFENGKKTFFNFYFRVKFKKCHEF